MSRRDDSAWIEDTLDAVKRLLNDVKDVSYQEYLQNSQLQRAVLFDLTVLVEASGKVSDNLKNEYDQLPWQQMKGLRNRVIHAYFEIDHAIVWEVLTREIPDLLPQLESLRKQLGSSETSDK